MIFNKLKCYYFKILFYYIEKYTKGYFIGVEEK